MSKAIIKSYSSVCDFLWRLSTGRYYIRRDDDNLIINKTSDKITIQVKSFSNPDKALSPVYTLSYEYGKQFDSVNSDNNSNSLAIKLVYDFRKYINKQASQFTTAI